MENCLHRFKENAESTTATVELVDDNINEITNAIKNQIKNEKCILVSVEDESLLNLLSPAVKLIQKPDNDEIKNTSVCLTNSVLGIASTGSIVIDNDDGLTLYMTMLTSKHIVILDSENIVDKPREIFNQTQSQFISENNFSIITGPSATADMGSLVRGVHGPGYLHIILTVKNES